MTQCAARYGHFWADMQFTLVLIKIHDYNGFVNILSAVFDRKWSVVIKMALASVEMGVAVGKGGILREVNLKSDLPTVDDAIRRVTYNLKNAGAFGVSAIKFIHGYGSSGKGGGIRTEMRKYLERQKARGQIKDYIIGEKFSIFDEGTRKAFDACDELRRDSDLERHNNGITIVVL